MPAQLTTRQQVNGYRFLLRRLEHALVRRDVRMLHDPMRSQSRSMAVGLVMGILGIAGCAILAFIRPQGAVNDAKIVMGKDSGALYAVVDGKLHPALNLSSARLVTDSNEKPKSVKDSKLGSYPRGPLVGIPGAPAALPGSASSVFEAAWTLCEKTELSSGGSAVSSPGVTTTVIAGKLEMGDWIREIEPDEALLATRTGTAYLLYDGKRAEIDLDNSAVVRALKLQGRKPRPIGVGLLDAAPEVPHIAPPAIPRAGEPGTGALSDVKIGAVVRVSGVDSAELYVVVPGGVQRISALAAQVIRNANSVGQRDITAIAPDALDGVPVLNTLPVGKFPVTQPKLLTAEENPVVCMAWEKEKNGSRTVRMLAGKGLPITSGASPVKLATADSVGEGVDEVYIKPATGEYIQATGIEENSSRRDSLFYIADNGIKYGIPNKETAAILGLGDNPKLAPWPIIGQLIPGPTLSKDMAMVTHDSLPQARFGE